MAHNQRGIRRPNLPCAQVSGVQKRQHIESAQAAQISPAQSPQTKLEDLGRPSMGWMPRSRVMEIIQQIDADLTRDKDV